MKKILVALLVIIALSIGISLFSKGISETGPSAVAVPPVPVTAPHAVPDESAAADPGNVKHLKSGIRDVDHSKKRIDCKSCHACEYPTKRDACLVMCPRNEISIHHSPDEAPELLVMNELSNRFGNVVFSHKLHAQMSDKSIGCTGCHHYNTTGPVLSCKKCHEKSRKRDNISVPDLEAAYHRQCMPCHRQWGQTTDCNSCHLPKGDEGAKKKSEAIRRTTGKSHPVLKTPTKVVYETTYDKGKFVTFYHDDHINLFRQPCASCHKDDNCIKCHDVKKKAAGILNQERHLKVHKTFDEHHKACLSCHEKGNCTKCHLGREMGRFNHAVSTGWDLGRFHSRLACEDCHVVKKTFSRLDKNCGACHINLKPGKFDHKVTGLALSSSHRDLECASCHPGNNYSSKPVCKECHNDMEFPKALPGKRLGKR